MRRPLLLLSIACFLVSAMAMSAYAWSMMTLQPGKFHQWLIGSFQFDVDRGAIVVIRGVAGSYYNVFDLTFTHVAIGFILPSLLILIYLAIRQSRQRRGFPVQ
jgi:hypothetical protein